MEQLPPMINSMVVVQCVCFSLFGCVPLTQVVLIMLTRADHIHRIWRIGALCYSVLSVLSKGMLAVMFVMLTTDGNCVNTTIGRACLY